MSTSQATLLLAACCVLGSCSGETRASAAAAPRAVSLGTGMLSCTVLLGGAAPELPLIDADKNVEHCGAVVADSALLVQAGGVASAVVWIEVPGFVGDAAEGGELALGSRGCLLQPRVQSARPGVRLVMRNGDPITHNPHGWSEGGLSVFNVTLLDDQLEVKRVLHAPGIYRIDCDTHSWMRAYVHVFEHPFHAVTDGTGHATIQGLPAGEWQLHVWHEVLGGRVVPFRIEEKAVLEVELELLDRRAPARVPPGMRPWIARAPVLPEGAQ